jgi:hypothetical protein
LASDAPLFIKMNGGEEPKLARGTLTPRNSADLAPSGNYVLTLQATVGRGTMRGTVIGKRTAASC